MKETITKIKNRFHREVDRVPSETEILRKVDRQGQNSSIAICAAVVVFLGIVLMLIQPVSFTGEIVVSGGIAGDVMSNTTLSNYSESFETTNAHTNVNATIDNMDGEIRISGNYEMPIYAYYKFLAYLEED